MSASAPPSWLFSNNFTKTNDTTPTTTTPQQDKMVKKEKSEKKAKAVAAPTQQAPPDQLMDLVDSFLSENSFTSAHEAFQKQRAKSGWKPSKKQTTRPDLVTVFQSWQTTVDGKPVAAGVDVKNVKVVSSDSSSSDSDSSSSDSDSSSDDEDVDMADAAADSDSSSSSSSSSDSDSDSSSDSESEDEKPAPKNALKRKAPESDSSSSRQDCRLGLQLFRDPREDLARNLYRC
ncbi:uncharacterized protein ColSpa_06661 [Colletotrichum spaethianum]|uniref:LisH domain-containing protein n=1 Tax=Colletotrichum spaethianum TaxID=700344 RepID=A0AA37LIB8_9PEZI|nr:uncharacterized protein ColSpa_06661 [Colletotrichum spaethianum]GKT46480.1 hypothetical protein ColSpa_06661 [Colletotrichum spaethianum]